VSERAEQDCHPDCDSELRERLLLVARPVAVPVVALPGAASKVRIPVPLIRPYCQWKCVGASIARQQRLHLVSPSKLFDEGSASLRMLEVMYSSSRV
jgi:hypothetical protein